MNETYVTVCGNLTADPETRVLPSGVPVTSFRVASSARRRAADGSYADGPTSFYKVSCFRWLARNVEASLAKGMPVVVHGRQRVSQWTTAEGVRSSGVEIEAHVVGPDLNRLYGRLARGTAPTALADPLDDPTVQAAFQAIEQDVERDVERDVVQHGGAAVDRRSGEVLDSPFQLAEATQAMEPEARRLLATRPDAAELAVALELRTAAEVSELLDSLAEDDAEDDAVNDVAEEGATTSEDERMGVAVG